MALINTLNGIGDAIREKVGGTELIPLKEMADVIRSISGGESVEHSSITYNDDDTITLIETNGKVHTMSCEYENGKLVGLKYDNEVIPLTYEDDVLVGIGGMEVDVSKAPADTRLKDFVEGTSTEIVDDTITKVFQYAFYKHALQKIDLPNCITVNDYGFADCNNIVYVNLPKCENFGVYAFRSCTTLKEIELPKAKTLGNYCFSSCTNVQKIVLDTVTTIGDYCFYYCKALTKLIIKTSQVVGFASTSPNPFSNTPIQAGSGRIYVPDSLVEDYKNDTRWSVFASKIKGLSELEVANNE